MCQYVKDDGEQCGRTAEPFCHDHEDTAQANVWLRLDDLYEEMEELTQKVVSGSQSGSSGIEMDTTCDQCGSALRRVERLSDHDNLGGQMMFVATVECDCSEHVLGTQAVRIGKLPEGWL